VKAAGSLTTKNYVAKGTAQLSLCLINLPSHHEDAWGSGGTATPSFTSALDGSGQFHAPGALSAEKEPPVSIEHDALWAPEPVETLWRREKSCAAGNRTRAVQPVARR
jgi:hypothetical protein